MFKSLNSVRVFLAAWSSYRWYVLYLFLCLVILCIVFLLMQQGIDALHIAKWSAPFLTSGDPIGGGGGTISHL